MVEARLLEEHIARLQRKTKARHRLKSTYGQEACRVSTALELTPGDLVSDAQAGVIMDLLFGAKIDSLLRSITAFTSGKKQTTLFAGKTSTLRQLPWISDGSDRLKLALGAALTFKTLKQKNIVISYVLPAEISQELWKQTFALAAKFDLPIILVVLPDAESAKRRRRSSLCAKARAAGIPGIPVDANDAVALYRVAQESIGRARGGDGPVLIDCIPYPPVGQQSAGAADPILYMKEFMVGRKICTSAWADRAGDAFRNRIVAVNHSIRKRA
ncbi:MAG: thiamine pyrophosphate-dependent enzyme [Edaphobacter sp.]